MAHVAQWKIVAVKQMEELIGAHPVVGLVRVDGIPGPQLLRMRRGLRGSATLRVAKKTLIELALKRAAKVKPGVDQLMAQSQGQIALITSSNNPFMLFKKIEGTKAPSPARPGDIAPEDIVVSAGETPFKPGPIVGELQRAGIPAAIEQGKVVIKKDKLLVKAGEPIPAGTAQMLTRLEIFPMIVGLDVVGLYEEGILYKPKDLSIDAEAVHADLVKAAREAFTLAMVAAIPTPATTVPLLQKAYRDAVALGIAAAIPVPETVGVLLSKAHAQMLAVARRAPEALDADLASLLVGQAAPAASPTAEAAEPSKKGGKDDEEKEEEVSEEEAAAGLGALFG